MRFKMGLITRGCVTLKRAFFEVTDHHIQREKVGTLDINLDNWAPISWGDGILYRGTFIPADCIFSIRGRYFPQ